MGDHIYAGEEFYIAESIEEIKDLDGVVLGKYYVNKARVEVLETFPNFSICVSSPDYDEQFYADSNFDYRDREKLKINNSQLDPLPKKVASPEINIGDFAISIDDI